MQADDSIDDARAPDPESEQESEQESPPDSEPESEPEPEPEWWEDPRLPWKGKPSRADIGCWVGFSLTGVYALVLLPLRPVLLNANPFLLAALGGSTTSAVTIGALAAIGQGNWLLGLLLGTFGAVKFDALYWWAGKLWGRGLIELVAGRSARSARNAARAERVAIRFGPLAVLATYVIWLPGPVVYATVAAAGMRLRTFLAIDIAAAAVTRGIYIYLGYRIGQPAIDVVRVIGQYSWYISIALLVGIFGNLAWQSWQRRRRALDRERAS